MEQLQQKIEAAYEQRYRPEAVAILRNSDGKYLLLKSKEGAKTPWSYPQGGIDEGESLQEAFERELGEETGIKPSQLENTVHGFMYRRVEFEAGRKIRQDESEENPWKGKDYFFSCAQYTGSDKLDDNKKEAGSYGWFSYEQATNLLNKARPEKAEMLKKAMDESIKILGK